MRLTALVLIVALPAFAAEPADAPTLEASGDLVRLEPGQPAPRKLSCLTDEAFIASEQGAREDHEIAKAVKPGSGYVILPTWSVVAIVAAALAASAGVTAGVILATQKRAP